MLASHPDHILSMKGSTTLVTGASSGLGAHFAKVLAAAGAKVALGARRTDRLEELVDYITASGGKAIAVELDVTSSSSIDQAIDHIESSWGPVSVLVNNAGVADSKRCTKITDEDWDYVMSTNLKGAWRVATEVSRRLLSQQKLGSIVNIASILGLRVGFGQSVYSISKAGVVQMTKAMALELGPKGIRVNALCPGYFKTEINAGFFGSERGDTFIKATPSQRLGDLSELDAPLLTLASDAGSFINGAVIPVDGGHLVSSL